MNAIAKIFNHLSQIKIYLILAILLLAFVKYSLPTRPSAPEEPHIDPYSQFEFLQAVYKGDVARVEELLSSGVSPNTRQRETPITHSAGDTALIVATYMNHMQIAELLIRAGADVNEGGHIGRTPLLKTDDLRLTELLIMAGADVNKSDETGRTPLMVAGMEEAKLLIDSGADVNAKDNYGMSALMYAGERGDCETTELLLAHGADIHARSTDGWTVLMSAVRGGRSRCCVERLLMSGPTPMGGWVMVDRR
jgi:ankyrin repeat protein